METGIVAESEGTRCSLASGGVLSCVAEQFRVQRRNLGVYNLGLSCFNCFHLFFIFNL